MDYGDQGTPALRVVWHSVDSKLELLGDRRNRENWLRLFYGGEENIPAFLDEDDEMTFPPDLRM